MSRRSRSFPAGSPAVAASLGVRARLVALLLNIVARARPRLRLPAFSEGDRNLALIGLGFGIVAWSAVLLLLSTLGATPPVLAGMGATTSLLLVAGSLGGAWFERGRPAPFAVSAAGDGFSEPHGIVAGETAADHRHRQILGVHALAAAWTGAVLPAMPWFAGFAAGRWMIESDGGTAGYAAWATFCCGAPLLLALGSLGSLLSRRSDADTSARRHGTFLLAAAAGMLLNGFLLGWPLGLWGAAWVGVALLGTASASGFIRPKPQPSAMPPEQEETRCAPDSCEVGPSTGRWQTFARGAADLAASALLGGVACGASWMAAQWTPASVYFWCAGLAFFFAGAGTGLRMPRRGAHGATAAALAALLALPAAAETIVGWLTWSNAFVTSVALQLLVRSLVAGIPAFLVGVGFAGQGRGGRPPEQGRLALRAAAVIAGWLAARGMLSSGTEPDAILRIGGLPVFVAFWWAWMPWKTLKSTLATRVSAASPDDRPAAAFRFSRGAAASAAMAAGLGALAAWSVGHSTYRPETAARLLFSTHVLAARQSGIPVALLAALDDGLLESVQNGSLGTLTVWRHNVSQQQVRLNGVPKSIRSLNSRRHPQYSGEVLPGLVPCVLHERADRVLFLGLQGGEALRACLSGPVLEVVCVEPEAGLIGLAEIEPDDRLLIRRTEPALFLQGCGETFDVIVGPSDAAILAHAQPWHTREFYRRASAALAPGGVFAQRFQFADFGPEALEIMSATLQSVFADVRALEMAPGEMLFLATNDERGLIRPAMLQRAEAPQVRRAMAALGWDWTVLLTLGAYRAESLAAGRPASPNAAASGLLAQRLPIDLMSWRPKAAGVQQLLAPRVEKLLAWLDPEQAAAPALMRRLGEVKSQQELLASHPDQYWAYRRTVRDQVTHRSRTALLPAAFEKGGMDPEDRRRMQYFKLLAHAHGTRDREAIWRLELMEEPYDPLVSYFLHQEVAELYARVAGSSIGGADELDHRLHALYYGSQFDRSIHNLLRAMKHATQNEALSPSPRARYALLNSLVHALQLRWDVRGRSKPGIPREMLRDAEHSLSAAEQALFVMAELEPQAGVPAGHAELRRRVVTRHMLNPLRRYREELLKQVQRTRIVDDDEAPAAPSVQGLDLTPPEELPQPNDAPPARDVEEAPPGPPAAAPPGTLPPAP